ncbi:hypothetical protein [Ectobacillus sp. sgz5001026]|uniref:hypothetical protein n=1 Tax=Ectobacillus sp. sgz5001026 TaxID=3242473 RepID=UPI0036D261B3
MKENQVFLEVIQQSESKRNASFNQLLSTAREDVEELADEASYEAMIAGEYDDELENLLGESLFHDLQNRLLEETNKREALIQFIDGLGFHILDWIVVLETECGVRADAFTTETIKALEKHFPYFPYVNETTTIFEKTVQEVNELLKHIAGESITFLNA